MGSFKFKKFEVLQENSAMKVNTDGVLLGAWLTITGTEGRMLDVGTGTGVIALMAAQRFAECSQEPAESGGKLVKCQIDAIDIDAASVEDAAGNFERSGFASSVLGLEARHISLQELAAETELKYDLIFSNPPYFINSLKSSDGQRSNARHTDTLGQGELLKCAMDLLAPEGRLAVVLPAAEGELLLQKIDYLRNRGVGGYALQPARLCRIHTTIKKPAKRWLMEFVYTQESLNLVESQLTIMSDGDYTAGYKSLTGDFYLNF
ncbi:MAG: methyltransferase domain-containing protein [Bacteroidales bacterium]|nr:methyltransferase domain-containing protein [Bacteroidales bacterium]